MKPSDQNDTFEAQNNIYISKTKIKSRAVSTILSDMAEMKKESLGNYGNWNSVTNHINLHNPKDVSFDRVNGKNGFKDLKITLIKSQNKTKTLHFLLNSKYSYFNKLIAALNQAVKEEIIPSKPCIFSRTISQDETQREFLTYEELLAMVNAPCKTKPYAICFYFHV